MGTAWNVPIFVVEPSTAGSKSLSSSVSHHVRQAMERKWPHAWIMDSNSERGFGVDARTSKRVSSSSVTRLLMSASSASEHRDRTETWNLPSSDNTRESRGDPRTFFGKIYGQEKNLTTSSIARMNLVLHGIEDVQIVREDTLRSPAFTDSSTGGLATFDCVIANPPFSLKEWGHEVWEADPWGRAAFGLPPDNYGDFAWVQHMVASMAAGTGRMAVVLPQGALFRKGAEGAIRQHLLERDLIEAVIGLGPNIFYGTGLAPAIVVLRRAKPATRKGQVLIADASTMFRKGRAQNFLDPEHREHIVAWVHAFKDVANRAKVISLREITAEDWTLNISRYVLPPIGEEIPPLPEAIATFKQALSECRAAEDRLREVLTDGGWLA